MGIGTILGYAVQVIVAIPKIADAVESAVYFINQELKKKRKKEREKQIKKAVEDSLKNKDAAGLEGLLNRHGIHTSTSKKMRSDD